MQRRTQRRWFVGALGIVGVICWYLLLQGHSPAAAPVDDQPASTSAVALVNGAPIARGEFQRALIQNRAAVYDYFYTIHGVQDGPTFWVSSYGGETPINMLRTIALEKCVRVKVQQLLAQRQGVVRDISEAAFLQQLAEENRLRAERLQQRQPVYGPKVYSEEAYFAKRFGDMLTASTQVFAQHLTITDADMEDFYRRPQAHDGLSYQAAWEQQPFERVKEQIRLLLIQRAYMQAIDELVHTARITLDHSVYDQTFVR